MTHSEKTRITLYGCGPDEAALFRELAPALDVRPVITDAPVCAANAELASGSRCISVDHRTPLTHETLRALARIGVRYISTRSIGYDHIDVAYARRAGMLVENVSYSPDSVADYTLMLMLMTLRDAKAMVRRTDAHDYRLSGTRGKELRDLTVGVVGTGRIGTAVMNRLKGFGCRIMACDERPAANPGTAVEHVPLDELLLHSRPGGPGFGHSSGTVTARSTPSICFRAPAPGSRRTAHQVADTIRGRAGRHRGPGTGREIGHSRGSTARPHPVRRGPANSSPLGGGHDLMDPLSHHDAPGITPTEARNRQRLRSLMETCGFRAYAYEWWHYTLADEPYPDTYFDFPVR
ncbi:D-alanyl-D-alanine dipeptidase [Streptomyces fumanus]